MFNLQARGRRRLKKTPFGDMDPRSNDLIDLAVYMMSHLDLMSILSRSSSIKVAGLTKRTMEAYTEAFILNSNVTIDGKIKLSLLAAENVNSYKARTVKDFENSEYASIKEELTKWFINLKPNQPEYKPTMIQLYSECFHFPAKITCQWGSLSSTLVQVPYQSIAQIGISLGVGTDEARLLPFLLPGVIPFDKRSYSFNALIQALRCNSFFSIRLVVPTETLYFGHNIGLFCTFVITKAHGADPLVIGSFSLHSKKKSEVCILEYTKKKTVSGLKSDGEVGMIHVDGDVFDRIDETLSAVLPKDAGACWLHYSIYTYAGSAATIDLGIKGYLETAIGDDLSSDPMRPLAFKRMREMMNQKQAAAGVKRKDPAKITLFDLAGTVDDDDDDDDDDSL